MVIDRISALETEYRNAFKIRPKFLFMSVNDYATLIEELDTLNLERFHGMEIIVDESLDMYVE